MSRRDTIIIAVLINACLLVILFATSITKKDEKGFGLNYEAPLTSPTPSIQFNDVERSLVKETKSIEESYPLQSPLVRQTPIKVEEKKVTHVETKPAIAEIQHIEVTVKSGDYLDKIGRENDISVSDIMSYNGLKSTQLRIGQVLRIPLKNSKDSSKPRAQVKQYIVKAGDTPWGIANQHNMQLDELLKLNHLDKESSRHLKPGDTLYIR